MPLPLREVSEFLKPNPHGFSLEWLHQEVGKIQLGDHCSDLVRQAFNSARHALILSVVHYEMTMLAQTQSLIALEMAATEVFGTSGGDSLGKQINHMRDRGILPSRGRDDPADTGYFLHHFRNELTHGSWQLHSPDTALPVLEVVADLINRLFTYSSAPGP